MTLLLLILMIAICVLMILLNTDNAKQRRSALGAVGLLLIIDILGGLLVRALL